MKSKEKTKLVALTISVIAFIILSILGCFGYLELHPEHNSEGRLPGNKFGLLHYPLFYYSNNFSLFSLFYFGSIGSAFYYKFVYDTKRSLADIEKGKEKKSVEKNNSSDINIDSYDKLHIDSLKELATLKEKGHLTQEEYEKAKKRII